MNYKLLLVDTRQEIIDSFGGIEWSDEFSLEICSSGQEAISYLKQHPAHLIFIANKLADMDGTQFVHHKNHIADAEQIPVFVLSDEENYKTRIQQILEGIDDYMLVPFDPNELETRARIILKEKYQVSKLQERSSKGFSGNLNEMNLLDLIQSLELGKKTGTIRLHRGMKEARIYIQDGLVFDAESDSKIGENALFDLFTWTEGYFFTEFAPINRERKIQISSEELIIRGMKILEEWETIQNEVPGLFAVPKMKTDIKDEDFGSAWDQIIKHIDGIKSLKRIIGYSPLNEIQILTQIVRMQEKGILELEVQEEFKEIDSEDFIFNDDSSIGEEKVKQSINFYVDGLLRKQKPNKQIEYLDSIDGSAQSDKNGEKIKSELIFDKVELQYIKRKLL